MQINRISPPAGFIIICLFNEVAIDIETTPPPRLVFHREGSGVDRDHQQMAQTGVGNTGAASGTR